MFSPNKERHFKPFMCLDLMTVVEGFVLFFPLRHLPIQYSVPRGEGRGRIYLSVHCLLHNDSYIKIVDSYESHVNAALIVRDKVTRQCPQITPFYEKGEPKWIRTEVPLLTSLTP